MVAAVAGLAGYYFDRDSLNSEATDAATEKLMRAPLTDVNGKAQAISQWRGKVLVVNFWAPWCVPCREEIPALTNAHRKYLRNSVEFVGIAFDSAVKVREYADEMGIDYALLIGAAETLMITKDLGNRAQVLPFTVVLDPSGKVAYTHAGALTAATLDVVLTPLLPVLKFRPG
jgi:thiol-disulfide isomerase/thioredoxin